MVLTRLKLVNFRNYEEASFEFASGINCIMGLNGMGKTNLLDAIHYLSMTRSSQSNTDQEVVCFDHNFFSVIGDFVGGLSVNCYFENGRKKSLKVNGSEPDKLSEHIGKIPLVITTPDDVEIIKEGSETRRKLFDRVISQYDRSYLDDLITCRKLLNQRNSFLKQNEGRSRYNKKLLQTYDDQLIPLFTKISTCRKTFFDEFESYFVRNYQEVFDVQEQPSIMYKTMCLNDDFRNKYVAAVEKDVILTRTSMGSHRDDFIFLLNGKPTKKFGSQGQQKTLIIALKLSEFDFLRSKKDAIPLLLLDDIFDKLDDQRIAQIVKLLVNSDRFSQVFLTDARTERVQGFFGEHDKVSFYEINNGQLNGKK